MSARLVIVRDILYGTTPTAPRWETPLFTLMSGDDHPFSIVARTSAMSSARTLPISSSNASSGSAPGWE